VRRYGLHATVKLLISTRLGVDCGAPRPPLPSLTREETDLVLAQWEELASAYVGR
jgi:dihydrodipicolinate synthase/N-acetylneuraminate lyase